MKCSNDEIDICVGSPLSLSVEPVPDGLYQWIGPNGFEASGTDVGIDEAMLFDSGVYVVQGFSGACDIENDTVTVVVHSPLPAPVLSEDVTVCEGFSLTVGADTQTWFWTGPNGDEHEGQFWVISDMTLNDAGVIHSSRYRCLLRTRHIILECGRGHRDDLIMDWTAEFEICPRGKNLVLKLPDDVVASNPSIQWSWMAEGATDGVDVSDQVEFTVTDGHLPGRNFSPNSLPRRKRGVVQVMPLSCALC